MGSVQRPGATRRRDSVAVPYEGRCVSALGLTGRREVGVDVWRSQPAGGRTKAPEMERTAVRPGIEEPASVSKDDWQ